MGKTDAAAEAERPSEKRGGHAVATQPLLAAGALAAVCWAAADMLLVGFVPAPEKYPLLSQTLAADLDGKADLALLMLDGSPERLFWGVLPATFSVALYLAAAFGVYRLMRRGRAAACCFALLFAAYALSPLGHAGFYYLGMSAQTLPNAAPADHALLLAQFAAFYRMLAVHWWASVGCAAAAFLILLVQTLRGQTSLPRRAAWFNPLPVGALIAVLCSLFPQSVAAAAVGGATFNLAQLAFFLSALFCLRRQKAV
ncbi:DUF6796 family protein [Neisseria sp. 23W00296]|uniref:DUF6796 family protein n=1 Tax=unclassified Neisseria TaxID=2623750 RepID=UPI003756DBBA